MKLYFYEDANAADRQSIGIEFWSLAEIGVIGFCSEHSVTFCSKEAIETGIPDNRIDFNNYRGTYRPASIEELTQNNMEKLLSGYILIADSWRSPKPYFDYMGNTVFFKKTV